MAPSLWTLAFIHALMCDMQMHEAERGRSGASACRFAGWEKVETSISGYLLQLRELRAIIVSLGPWYMLEHVPAANPDYVPATGDGAPGDREFLDALAEWTDDAIHRAVFPVQK